MSKVSQWFWGLPFAWQNVIGFGGATIVGVGMAVVIIKVIPAEWKDIASLCMFGLAILCLLRVAIGISIDRKHGK